MIDPFRPFQSQAKSSAVRGRGPSVPHVRNRLVSEKKSSQVVSRLEARSGQLHCSNTSTGCSESNANLSQQVMRLEQTLRSSVFMGLDYQSSAIIECGLSSCETVLEKRHSHQARREARAERTSSGLGPYV